MALYTYGGTPADVLTDTAGNVVPDYPVIVRAAGTGAAITGLLEADGTTPIAQLRTNPTGSSAPGAIRTFKVDGVTAIEYEYNAPGGTTVRWYQSAREAATGALDQIEGKVDKTGSTLTGKLQWGMANATDVVLGSFKTGDVFDRWRMTADGAMAWGSGAAARDTFLSRSAAGVLETPGTLVPGQVSLGGMRIFNPRVTFGALGTGAVDDAPAIQAALDAAYAAGGGWVIVPPGTYTVATLPLRVRHNTRLTLMEGATIRRGATGTMLLNGTAGQSFGGYTGHGNIIIEGGVWDARATAFPTSGMCMSIGHAENIVIRDTLIKDVCGYHGIEVNAVRHAVIRNVRGYGYLDPGDRPFSEFIQPDLAKSSGVFGGFGPYDDTPCVDLLIDGCSTGPSGTAGTTAWPRGVGSHSASPSKPHRDIRIVDCLFEDCAQYAIGGYTWDGVTVDNCQIRGCGGGIRMRTLDSSSTSHRTPAGGGSPTIPGSQPLRSVTITDCEITGSTGYDDAIQLIGEATGSIINAKISGTTVDGVTAGGQNGLRLEYVDDYTLDDNTVRDTAGTGISQENTSGGTVTGNRVRGTSGSGIACTTCSEVEIAGNNMRELGSNGIHVLGGSDITLDTNYIKGASRAAAGSWGIRASTSADGLLITGNKIRKYGSGNEVAAGIGITSTCTNVRRYGNDLGDTGLDDQSTGPETTPYDNTGALEDLMRPAGRYETTSRLRCGTSSSSASSGVLYLVPIWLPKGAVVSNLSFITGGTGVGTPTNYWFTLHDRSRVALARTADQTTTAWAANTTKTLAVAQTTAGSASSYTTTYSGLHYLGIMIKATTMPTLVGEGAMVAGSGSAPGFGDTNTGQTTPPTVTAGAFTAAAFGGGTGLLAYGYTT
ncbi:right-handed parallel beta-helix repeat-containing protein [Streptomyces longispororuber]|uniref:right-handed parallel beta-helix repeat-containing protein n=1 Tax=Streptomyces longispororuber TaxID=68230 RepID=UPI0036F8C112